MPSYRGLAAFTPAPPPTDATQYVFGLSFKATSPGCQLDGWWWYCDIANGQSTAAEDFALWQVTGAGTGTYIAGSVVTSGTFVQGWNFIPCATPIPLTSGQEYRAVKTTNKSLAGSLNYCHTADFFDTGSGSAGSVNGPLTVFAAPGAGTNPEPSGDGQMVFIVPGSTPNATTNYPTSEFQQSWYGLDIQISTPSGSVLPQQVPQNRFRRRWTQPVLPAPPPQASATPAPFYQPQVTRGRPAAARGRLRSASQPFPPVQVFRVPGKPVRGRPVAGKSTSRSSPGSPVVPRLASPFVPPATTTRGRPVLGRTRHRESPFPAASPPPSPFTLPGRIRSRSAATQARLRSSPGSPATVVTITPAPFYLPEHRTQGQPAAARSHPRSSPGSPVVPAPTAPFAQPERTIRGAASARKTRQRSSPGSPAVVVAITPSPFYLPEHRIAGRPAASRSRLASSPGSPARPPVPSVFVAPARTQRGRPIARRSRQASSAGSPAVVVPPSNKHDLIPGLFPF